MVVLQTDKPSILIPYAGPDISEGVQDIFVYLRPETNGVEVESQLFQVIQENPLYRKHTSLAYLANIPGAFIVENRIVEHHYALRLLFARRGTACFTEAMRHEFRQFFGRDSRRVEAYGAFEAMERLGYTEEELFNLWVPDEDMCIIRGEVIKRIGDRFIVNAYLPAVLHRNSNRTDIAAMIFRSHLCLGEVHELIRAMGDRLKEKGILNPDLPVSRAFHHSKGPFEMLLDSMGYLYSTDNRHIPLDQVSFCRFLTEKGHSLCEILGLVSHPIVTLEEQGRRRERFLYACTADMTYEEAYARFRSITALSLCANREFIDYTLTSSDFWRNMLYNPGTPASE